MTEDAKKLLECITDNSYGNGEEEQIIDVRNLVEIVDAERKLERLLNNLKQEKYIQKFKINQRDNTFAVKLSGAGRVPFEEESKLIAGKKSTNGKKRNGVDKIHDDVMDKFIKKRVSKCIIEPEIFEAYSDLFKYFVQVKNDDSEEQKVENLFEFIVDKVHQTDSENYIKILGPDGTGKSTFLSLLYLYLYECYDVGVKT